MAQRMTLERAYREWLKLPADRIPPDHYTLLDLPRFESDLAKIQQAVRARTALARKRTFKYHDAGTSLQNAIAAAGVCLTNPARKAEYDAILAAQERNGLPAKAVPSPCGPVGISLWSAPPTLSYCDQAGQFQSISAGLPDRTRQRDAAEQSLTADLRLLMQGEPAMAAVREAGLTIPFSLKTAGRDALRRAAASAGIATVELVTEGVAAAIAHTQELLEQEGDAAWELREFFGDRTILVVDLGEAGFHAALLKVSADLKYELLGACIDKLLAPVDWDDALEGLLRDRFVRAFSIDVKKLAQLRLPLKQEAARLRRDLALAPHASVAVNFDHRRRFLSVSRAEFQRAAEPLLRRLELTIEAELLTRLKWTAVESILLLNESATLPMIANRLQSRTGRQTDTSPATPELLSRGAALEAARRRQSPALATVTGKGKTGPSSALGLMAYDKRRGEHVNIVLIRADDPPGTRVERVLPVSPQARQVELVFLQGDAPRAADCRPLCKASVRGIQGNRPAELVATIGFGEDGVLEVTAVIRTAGGVKSVPVTLEEIVEASVVEGGVETGAAAGVKFMAEPTPPPVIVPRQAVRH